MFRFAQHDSAIYEMRYRRIRHVIDLTASWLSVSADHLLEAAGFGAGNCADGFAVAGFAGANGFTKTSLKS